MVRAPIAVVALGLSLLIVVACSSSSSPSNGGSGGSCPSVAGTWKITAHCDPSLVGQNAVVTQNGCALTFGAPFSGFTGTVTSDNAITVSGPQSCSGTVAASAISMTCTPGTCTVTLGK
jgi:hypothetical protein